MGRRAGLSPACISQGLSFLLPPLRSVFASLPGRYRSGRAGRARGLLLALVVEGLLILVVLTLGSSITQDEKRPIAITSIAMRNAPDQPQSEKKEEAKAPVISQAERPAQREKAEEKQEDTPVTQVPKPAASPGADPDLAQGDGFVEHRPAAQTARPARADQAFGDGAGR